MLSILGTAPRSVNAHGPAVVAKTLSETTSSLLVDCKRSSSAWLKLVYVLTPQQKIKISRSWCHSVAEKQIK